MIALKGKMGKYTSEGNMLGLMKKGKEITVQSISLKMTLQSNMKGDTAKGKMGTNTLKGNMYDMQNKQTQIAFCSNKSLTCSV